MVVNGSLNIDEFKAGGATVREIAMMVTGAGGELPD